MGQEPSATASSSSMDGATPPKSICFLIQPIVENATEDELVLRKALLAKCTALATAAEIQCVKCPSIGDVSKYDKATRIRKHHDSRAQPKYAYRYQSQIIVVFVACSAPAIMASIKQCPLRSHVFKIALNCSVATEPLRLSIADRVRLLEAGVNMFLENTNCLATAFSTLSGQVRKTVEETCVRIARGEPSESQSLDSGPHQGSEHADMTGQATLVDCPICGFADLTETQMHTHIALYHGGEENSNVDCPYCVQAHVFDFRSEFNYRRGLFNLHMHNCHGEESLREERPVRGSFAVFAWVIVRNPYTGRYLLTLEPGGLGGQFWFPAGRVDAGESLEDAAVRETMEEGGIHVRITGFVRYMMSSNTSSLRVILAAEPVDDVDSDGPEPGGYQKLHKKAGLSDPASKFVPNFESCGSMWASIEEIMEAPAEAFRGRGTTKIFSDFHRKYVAGGKQLLPLDHPEAAAFSQSTIRKVTSCSVGKRERSNFDNDWSALTSAIPDYFIWKDK